MAIPDQFTDLVKLNAFIGREYLDKQADKSDKSQGLDGGFDMYPGINEMDGHPFERISTGSGGVNDCLIYAFLQATCPNFRCLTDANKKVVASNYRRTHLKNIANTTAVYNRKRDTDTDDSLRDRQANILARIRSTEFLQDIEITILCEYYHIKILVFEVLRIPGRVISSSLVIYGGVERKNRDDDPVYMIYNPGNFHFETVRTSASYTISFRTAETLRLIYQPQQDGANMCKYRVGDKVDYEGREYYIVYRRLGDQGVCREYGLTRNKGVADELKRQAELGTPAGTKFIADNEVGSAERVVPAAAIEGAVARTLAAPVKPPSRVANANNPFEEFMFGTSVPIDTKAVPKPPSGILRFDKVMQPPSSAPTEKEEEVKRILEEIEERNRQIEALQAKIAAKRAAKGPRGGTRRKRRRTGRA
jgi:hypothetical protein